MKNFINNFKKVGIIFIILYILVCIFVVAPLSMTTTYGNVKIDPTSTGLFIITDNMQYAFSHPFEAIGFVLKNPTTAGAYFFNYFGIVTIVYWLISIFIILKMNKEVSEWDGIEHGSAGWAKDGEQYSVLSKTSGILLAKDNYLPVDKRGNVNVLVIGGSGSGKSATFVTPNVTQLLGSYVYTDPKGELYDKTASYFRENGYEVKVLNLVSPKNSDGFNPLFNINNETDLDIVTNTIVRGQSTGATGGDPYWDDNAETLLKALILFLKEAAPKEERNLASCANLVRLASNNKNFNHMDIMMEQLPSDHKARTYYESVKLAADKAYSSILSTLQSKLGKFESDEIAALTATNTINFTEIAEKKTALFVISSDTHATYDFLLTIFFSQLIQQLYNHADSQGGALKVPVYFFLDEFANIGQIPDFDKKISTSRSRKISFSVILQSLDQLENIYKESFETIMANCDTHLFLGTNSAKTSEYFSKQLGEVTIWDKSVSVSESKDNKENDKGKSESTSTNKFSRPLMTADEIRRLGDDQCIIIEKGVRPILGDKYYYFKEPKGMVLQNYKADNREYFVERGKWRKFDPTRKDPEEINERFLEKFENEKPVGLEEWGIPNTIDLKEEDFKKEENSGINNLSINDFQSDPKNQLKKENTTFNLENMDDQMFNTTNELDNKEKVVKNFEVNISKILEEKFDEIFSEDDNNKKN